MADGIAFLCVSAVIGIGDSVALIGETDSCRRAKRLQLSPAGAFI
ncbi:MAG TPA: hypothetical protein VFW87_22185 [Pirellulales bacterium]|nr:hypothetical protein [Pirellulales bacterium]